MRGVFRCGNFLLVGNERLRQLFAEKANAVGPWLERQIEYVLSIGLGGRGSLENTVSQLKSIQQQVYTFPFFTIQIV